MFKCVYSYRHTSQRPKAETMTYFIVSDERLIELMQDTKGSGRFWMCNKLIMVIVLKVELEKRWICFLKKAKETKDGNITIAGRECMCLVWKKYIRRWINFQTELMENGLKERGYKNWLKHSKKNYVIEHCRGVWSYANEKY